MEEVMKRMATGRLAVALALVLVAGVADAGWEIHSRSIRKGGQSGEEVSYFQKDRIRSESADMATVMDFSSRKIVWIDKKERKYSVMTIDEFKKTMREGPRQASQAMEEMKKQGIPVPGSYSRPKGKVTVSRLTGATVAGYACDGYRVSVGGDHREDIWVTKKIDLKREIGPAVWREFEDLSQEMKTMGFRSDDYETSEEYRKIGESGYPMKIVDRESGGVQEVTRGEKKTIPASLFEEPPGYEKVPFDRMTRGSAEGMPTSGEKFPGYGKTIRRGAKESRGEGVAGQPVGGAYGKGVDSGQASSGEAKGTATPGAQEPTGEKKGEVLGGIREGAKEGIKKLLPW
jgi:hypothetical protein